MPVKKSGMKRKLKTSTDKSAVPVKIGRRGVSLGVDEIFVAKRAHERGPGQVLTLGQNHVGQLGLGPDVLERARPALVPELDNIVEACAGGMHTICLTNDGEVITFGCNDEGALGRSTAVEDSETKPGKVKLDAKAVQVSAGDSHSAALLEDGRVFAWGAFRDSHGTMGLTIDGIMQTPTLMGVSDKVMRIASGTDHLLMLTRQGQLYTCGCGEQGQLGRLSERGANRSSRQGLNQLLMPALVKFNIKSRLEFDQIWTGAYCTFVREKEKGKIFVFGLNNYKQLGLDHTQVYFHPSLSEAFSDKNWLKVCGGQHHTLALDSNGVVYSMGRKEYGMLGLGEKCTDMDRPTPIPALQGKKCIDISCGSSVSFAVTEDGEVYAWGMGTNGQLGTGEEDDQFEPAKMGGEALVINGGYCSSLIKKTTLSTFLA
ncbi:regulator of chromosome condensation-like isoform X2 [Homalodisca vitripennis]|uniref:regulator of chromosome condensation-like isoform X2 n=1 Tax=Homalodisca vitripennis TaxID=197043 RepID=UPI001EEAE7F7|nr:regulator of chromosome condensation-like isoform X2 [Homalodisca vitripennis]